MDTNKLATKEQSKLISMFVSTSKKKSIAVKHKFSTVYINYIASGSRRHDEILKDLLREAEKNKNKFISELA